MNTPRSITTNVCFDLEDAPEVFDADGPFIPTCCWWEATCSRFGFETRIVANTGVRFARFTPIDVPAWIPCPPDGWDAAPLAAWTARETGKAAA